MDSIQAVSVHRPPSALGRVAAWFERLVKETFFDCRMCGQCILHSTGMTCPMRCPKNLRNGPCGGVQMNGKCEVFTDKPCVWVLAWERSQRLPLWRDDMKRLNPPVDWRLKDTSSWLNLASGRDRHTPAGWRPPAGGASGGASGGEAAACRR